MQVFSLVSRLYEEQQDAIEALFTGMDVLGVLPTGFGKTMIVFGLVVMYSYLLNGEFGSRKRLPSSRCFRPVAVVISPLISIMSTQCQDFNKGAHGLQAVNLSGEVDARTRAKVVRGEYNVLFMSPESALGEYVKILKSAAYTLHFLLMKHISSANGETNFERTMPIYCVYAQWLVLLFHGQQ